MLRTRVIPTLLLKEVGLYKGIQFKNHQYVGDPINAVKIFNEKEVDELVFLDISATDNKRINYELIADISAETFMPFAYGGGISQVQQIEKLFHLGVEKVIINTAAFYYPELITQASKLAGSQSIVVSIDVKKSLMGRYEVYVNNGKTRTKQAPIEYAKKIQDLGAGEVIVTSINREGTGSGYDLELLSQISSAVEIPIVASGGANSIDDFAQAVSKAHVSAVSAGSMFVFHGKHRAVLITYPSYEKLEQALQEN
ncbi:AglZ/HisF2 family acetamidino modification protein [Fastidiosibacter lacustris]|uniref:AglZ/HisF2 family acetamidino modification protein n=1 Tax=Fastidiosibacter lacustris TaxID=2056695 RepID=UPI000E345F10|nr:AglZ/HisF2 family acetamidino modification protein [Fastidiosibacter lacustris]